jgi:hypothetical protein
LVDVGFRLGLGDWEKWEGRRERSIGAREYGVVAVGSWRMSDLDSDLGLGEMGETVREVGRSSEDICKECILTG